MAEAFYRLSDRPITDRYANVDDNNSSNHLTLTVHPRCSDLSLTALLTPCLDLFEAIFFSFPVWLAALLTLQRVRGCMVLYARE